VTRQTSASSAIRKSTNARARWLSDFRAGDTAWMCRSRLEATSALTRFPTKTVEDMLKDRPAIMTFPRRAPVQGDLPITYRGEVVSAIGVSGMRPHEDEQIAQAGIQHLQTLST